MDFLQKDLQYTISKKKKKKSLLFALHSQTFRSYYTNA